jgi:hypothetical protein
VDGEQKLSGKLAGRGSIAPFRFLKQSEEERPWLIEERRLITSGS